MLRKTLLAILFSSALNPSAFAERFYYQQPQQIYDDTYTEEVDQKAQTVNTVRRYKTFDQYQGWLLHTQIVKRVRLKPAAPVAPPVAPIVAPKAAPVAPPAAVPEVKATPKEEVKVPEKKIALPLRTFKDDIAPPLLEIDPEATLLVPKLIPTRPAPPLTKSIPAALEKVTWVSQEKSLSKDEQSRLANDVGVLAKSTTSWQNDFLDRFSNCKAGFCLAKKEGTFEKLPMPFQVPMGQVRLLKLESEYLSYLLKQEGKPSPSTMAQVLRVVRRAEALRPLLEATAVVKERPYVSGMESSLAALQSLSRNWNYFTTAESKGWVLRWQLLALDVQVWTENLDFMSRVAKGEARDHLEKAAAEMKADAQKMGDAPWELPMNEQHLLAQRIYDNASTLYFDYPELSKTTEGSGADTDSYLGIIAFLGANENVRYLSYNVVISIDGK